MRQVLYSEQARLMQMQQQESEVDQVVVLTQEQLQIQCREATKKAVARSPLFANRVVTLPHSNETRSLHAVLGSEEQQRDHVAPSFTPLGRAPSAQARLAGTATDTPRGAVPGTLPAADFVVDSRASPQYIEGLRSCELPHSYTVATRTCNSPPAARVGPWTSMGGSDARCRPAWLVSPPPAAASRVATVSFNPSMLVDPNTMRRSFSARSLIRQLSPHPHVRSPLRSPSVIVHKPTKIAPGTPFRPVLASCSPRSLCRHAATPRRVPRIANGHLSACAFSELPVACEVGSIRISTPVHGSVTQAPTPARGGLRPGYKLVAPPQAIVTVSSHVLPPASLTPRSPLRLRPSPLDSSAMRVVHSSSHKSGTPTSVQHPKPPTGANKENMLLAMRSPPTACA